MFICECGAKFNNQRSKLGHSARCKEHISHVQNKVNLIDVTELITLYNEGNSLELLMKKYDVPRHRIEHILKSHNINLRTISQAKKTELCREKTKQTNIKLYGVENPSQSAIIKEKKRRTFIKNYGVDNIFKDPSFKDQANQTMLDKYGVLSLPNRYGKMQLWWNNQTNEFKKHHMKKANIEWKRYWNALSEDEKTSIIINRAVNGSAIGAGLSSLEDRLSKILSNATISHVRQKWINRRSYDFSICGTNLIIEVQGDYWHCNPDIFSENDSVREFNGNYLTVKDVWKRDFDKKLLAESYGYNVSYIWECDFKKMSDTELLSIVKKLIYENQTHNRNKK